MDHKLKINDPEVTAGHLFMMWMVLGGEGERFGQWVVNTYLEDGQTWPELFYVTCPIKAAKLIDEQLNLQREA